MNHHLPHVIYGAVVGHFIMALWRKLLTPAPRVIVVPSKPRKIRVMRSSLFPNASMFMASGHPEPRKVDNGTWIIERGLVDAMREEGYLFNTRTGGWDKDPNYVEPPEYEAMPF
jgi:hypothetical protein